MYRLIAFFKIWKTRLFNFIIPNFRRIGTKRIFFNSMPTCIQKTIFTGAGSYVVGENCNFGYKMGGFYKGGLIEIQARYYKSIIKIGNNVSTNNNLFFCAANLIDIGSGSIIGQYVTIFDHEAHGIKPEKRREIGEIGTVKIGNNVWIGNNVIILKNTFIGDNSIIAAGAVVSGSFPANVIIGGIPAKVIKNIV